MDWLAPTTILLVCFVLLLFSCATWVTYLVERPTYLQSSGGEIELSQNLVAKLTSQEVHDETHDVARRSIASESISEYPLRPGSSWIPVFDIKPLYHGFDPFGTVRKSTSYHLSVDHEVTGQFRLFDVPHPLIAIERIEFAGRFTYTGAEASGRINDILTKVWSITIRQGGTFGAGEIANVPVSVELLENDDDETQSEHGFHMVVDMSHQSRHMSTSFMFESPTEGGTAEFSNPLAGISGTAGVITVGTDPVTKFEDLASGWTGRRDIGTQGEVSLTGQIPCGWKGCEEHNTITGEPQVYLRNDSFTEDIEELTLKQGTRMTVTLRRPAFLPGVQPEHHHL